MKTTAPPFQVRTAGLIDRWPFHSTPGTRQDDVMLTVYLSGAGVYRCAQGTVAVQAGMVGLVPPEDPGILMAQPDDPYTHYYCRFNGAYAKSLALNVIAERGARFFRVPNVDEMAECLQPMGKFHRRELPARMGLPEVLLARALILLQEDQQVESAQELSAANLRYYLRDHVSDSTRLDAIAEHFGVSVSTLCRKARLQCGQTVQQIHEEAKMEWAKVLLASGTLNVTEVAQRVGYGDPFYFSRVFKQRIGRPPKAWSKKALRVIRREKTFAPSGW